MKFCELIKNNSWPVLKSALHTLYPGEKRNFVAYEKVFNRLKAMDCSSSDMMISIEKVNDKDDGDYVDVTGISTKERPVNGHPNFYAIEFCSWKKWMGMEIAETSMSVFTESEIIAHCMYKMTFMGFAEANIHHEYDELNKRVHTLETVPVQRKSWF